LLNDATFLALNKYFIFCNNFSYNYLRLYNEGLAIKSYIGQHKISYKEIGQSNYNNTSIVIL